MTGKYENAIQDVENHIINAGAWNDFVYVSSVNCEDPTHENDMPTTISTPITSFFPVSKRYVNWT